MKKATKHPPARTPAKKAPASQKSARTKPRQVLSQAQLLLILERLAHSAERLAQAAEQLALATVRSSPVPGSEQEAERQDEAAGEVVGVMVVDESDEE